MRIHEEMVCLRRSGTGWADFRKKYLHELTHSDSLSTTIAAIMNIAADIYEHGRRHTDNYAAY